MMIKLQKQDKKKLLMLARSSIEDKLLNRKTSGLVPVQETLHQHAGVFVSVYVAKSLRGCLGHFETAKPLWKETSELAVSAAFRDYRFPAISKNELNDLSIEISIIYPMVPILSIAEYNPKIHGIYLEKDGNSGTFLPQVAQKTGWDSTEMLRHCAHDKAGLSWDAWKNANLFIYETDVFSDN